MSSKGEKLREIFNTDEFNLLNVESDQKSSKTEQQQRLIDSFQEISDF